MITSDLAKDTSWKEMVNKDILELMGVANASEDQKAELYKTMLNTITNRVVSRIADVLDDSDLEKWEQLVKSGQTVELRQFLEQKQIDVDKFYQTEAVLYKIEMVELVKAAFGDRNVAQQS